MRMGEKLLRYRNISGRKRVLGIVESVEKTQTKLKELLRNKDYNSR